jgi:hypothetical protein
MKHKASELEGAELDAAVAVAEGWYRTDKVRINGQPTGECWWHASCGDPADPHKGTSASFLPRYSRDWSQAGPLIEREGITVLAGPTGQWAASVEAAPRTGYPHGGAVFEGPTPLIAAMRAFVASKGTP